MSIDKFKVMQEECSTMGALAFVIACLRGLFSKERNALLGNEMSFSISDY